MPIFKEMKTAVPIEQVLRRLGKKKRMDLSGRLARLVNEEVGICQALMSPMGIYEKFALGLDGSSSVVIGDGFSIESPDLYRWVDGCEEMILMVVTVGDAITTRTEDLMSGGETTRAMIADAIGSETVEELADVLNRIVSNTVRKRMTRRYSPGYGDWDIRDQNALLELIGAKRIGVTVNSASQMIPEKSISAAIGIKGGASRRG